jgi:tetratricopeptide (TPR) repeat protein
MHVIPIKTLRMKSTLLFILVLPFVSLAQAPVFDYGTKSIEARKAYQTGWEQILDLGQWTKAEESFRKAAALDPDFKLAWSQVGRISNDPVERASIYTKLKNALGDSSWESKLLEVYMGSLQLIDARDRGQAIQPEQVKQFYEVSLTNFSILQESFPDEPYINAEYIEVIHGIYGAKAALDSMELQRNSGRKTTPFLASYTSQMWAELKDFNKANEALSTLKTQLPDSNFPIILFTEANLFFEEGKLIQAEKLVNQALLADPKHTLAKRLKKRISEELKKQKAE